LPPPDSEHYAATLQQWLRDSTVIDSLSRLVNTDSLYRLNRAMLEARDPHDLIAPIDCEIFRLTTRHGTLPAEVAIDRMRDTLWKTADRAALRRLASVEGRVTMLESDAEHCGDPGPAAPTQIKGTDLNFTTRRPSADRIP
jgi:hypothetical protein